MAAQTTTNRTTLRFEPRELDATLARVRTVATLMDSRFTLPGTNVRVGLDAVLGLVPVVGDMAGQLVSVYLITEARRLGVPNPVLGRMIANTMVDALVGSIPIVGDVFDALFKANVRNLALLVRHLEQSDLVGK